MSISDNTSTANNKTRTCRLSLPLFLPLRIRYDKLFTKCENQRKCQSYLKHTGIENEGVVETQNTFTTALKI